VRRFNAFWLPILLWSCGGGDERDVVCDPAAAGGILIHVFDAPSGNPAACGVTATVTAPGFSEVHQLTATPCSDSMPILAAFERRGTYSVVVSKSGYQDSRIDNVVVTGDVCHVATVVLDVRLSP